MKASSLAVIVKPIRGNGTARSKLRTMLKTALRQHFPESPEIIVELEDFWIQQGAYRHATWDLARWGCYPRMWLHGGRVTLSIYSWDTMTECARRGIELLHHDRDGSWEFEVSVHDPGGGGENEEQNE